MRFHALQNFVRNIPLRAAFSRGENAENKHHRDSRQT
jgi:hypothetical protein